MLVSRRELAVVLVGPLGPLTSLGRTGRRPDPDQSADLTALTLLEASARVARREISAVELTEACLARIAQVNPRLNAFVTVTASRARSDAARRTTGPLGGVPIAHKDLFETRGILTAAGSRLFERHVPARDADLVARLTRAGCVLAGKTNTHELGGGVTTINPFYGTTRHPADPARISGGSSGGSAAAVAARMVPAATGSDTGGSVRIPAALCGCVGFKPSFGRFSTAGLLGACPTFDHPGFLTRTAADAAAVYEAARHPAARPFARPRRQARTLRVGVARKFFFDTLQPDVARAMERTIESLRTRGALIRDRDLPVDASTMSRVFDPIVVSEIWSRYGRDWRQRPAAFSRAFAEFFETPAPSRAEVSAAHQARRAFQAEIDRVFDIVDVILTPTVPLTAPFIDGPIDAALILRNTWPFNAARTPAISVPVGSDAAGLPIGVQLAGRVNDDQTVLDAARLLEA
jgi:aspartyl-tRNA(Asn)/glutamyl-tRNA(Gln) amidotransferase subunit A